MAYYLPSKFVLADNWINSSAIEIYMKTVQTIISFLHKKGVAHRDVKFDNIVFDNCGTIRIIDFETAVFTDCE